MATRLLDISRLISRVGQGPHTGIDRVEWAYFNALLNREDPVNFIARISGGYAVLDRRGGRNIFNKINGVTAWGACDLIASASRRISTDQGRAHSDLRRLSVFWTVSKLLKSKLNSVLQENVNYINVGHSNLRAEVFAAVKSLPNSTINVLLHDVIPLDYPEFSRSETVVRFQKGVALIARHADRIIYNSKCTQSSARPYLLEAGREPPGAVAHLGHHFEDTELLPGVTPPDSKPAFLMLGTIEPRKNHSMILNLWKKMSESTAANDMPKLDIVGNRGWNNVDVFDFLDTDPLVGGHIFEYNNLSDARVRQKLANCRALLFPSHVEGFGLPLIEAASMGTPIICGENAIYHEILGDYPLYLNVDNSYLWAKEILERAGRERESEADRQVRAKSITLSSWSTHFDQIFRLI